jgi:hypothetical protein
VIREPWDCLLNGPTLQLEPLAPGRFRVRRKDGGAVVGIVDVRDGSCPRLDARPAARRAEAAEVLRVLGPWLGGRARLELRQAAERPRAARGMRRGRLRRLALGPHPAGANIDWLAQLGIEKDYGARLGIERVGEPALLHPAGRDRHGRPQWLAPAAAEAWRQMREAAQREGIALEIVSGFRSTAYQAAIFRRKLARGLSLAQILAVNAAPGYSEHHSGRALDIGTPGSPPAEEPFEDTPAFAWLTANAGRHGFRMSYPRGNPQGFVYEPWHWCWQPTR